jgi:hypothetical protein
MNFIEAMKLLKEGYKITKDCWDKENYIYLEGHWVVFDEGQEVHNFSFYDYLYEGWKIYLKERKLHTFEEAIAAFKRGKTIRREAIRRFEYSAVNSSNPYFEIHDVLANDWIIVEEEV